jgi:hypothetical protein
MLAAVSTTEAWTGRRDDPVRLVQGRRDVPDDHDAIGSDLLEAQAEEHGETAGDGDG